MNEPEENYQSGFPGKAGWYDVLVDGAEDRLCFRYCPTCGMYVWQDLNGVKVPQDRLVLFIPESWDIRP